MSASVVTARRNHRSSASRRAPSRYLAATLLAASGGIVMLLGAALTMGYTGYKSSSRTVAVLKPSLPLIPAPPPPVRDIEHAAHKVATAFSVAQARGETLTAQHELVPRYLTALPADAVTRRWSLDGYTLRSEPVTDETCFRIQGGKAAAPSELEGAGIHCYRDALSQKNRLAFRLEPVQPQDRTWRKVRAAVHEHDGAAYVSLTVAPEVLDTCEPLSTGDEGTGRLAGQTAELAYHEVCVPAWRWEAVEATQLGTVVLNEVEKLNWNINAGGGRSAVNVKLANFNDSELAWRFSASRTEH